MAGLFSYFGVLFHVVGLIQDVHLLIFHERRELQNKQETAHQPLHIRDGTMADVPLQVISDNAASERRITPSWTISTLKTKLEPITGIPTTCQRLSLKASATGEAVPIEAADEDGTLLSSFPLAPYAELHVSFHSLSASQATLFSVSAILPGIAVLVHCMNAVTARRCCALLEDRMHETRNKTDEKLI